MPKYRILTQTNVAPSAKFRAPRAISRKETETIDVTATSLTNALLKVNIQFGRENRSPRIVSAEEILDIDTSEITDDQITQALTLGVPSYLAMDPDDYDGLTLYDQDDFEWIVYKVAEALRDSDLVPGLNLTVVANPDHTWDYTMVEIYEEATCTYRSVGRDSKRLIGDRSLAGWDGIISIARTLIEIVAAERLL